MIIEERDENETPGTYGVMIPNHDRLCNYCGEQRPSIVQCLICGDRLLDTVGLSPYVRLQLVPAPLYSEQEIQAVKELLLVTFHPLKASRINARWSLRQRALISRDANKLSTITGALMTYAEQILCPIAETQAVIEDKSSSSSDQDPTKSRDQEYSPKDFLHERPLEVFLLDLSVKELREFDGYQERERLLNRVSRKLLDRGRKIANYMISELFNSADLPKLIEVIKELESLELWLGQQRAALREGVRSDT